MSREKCAVSNMFVPSKHHTKTPFYEESRDAMCELLLEIKRMNDDDKTQMSLYTLDTTKESCEQVLDAKNPLAIRIEHAESLNMKEH